MNIQHDRQARTGRKARLVLAMGVALGLGAGNALATSPLNHSDDPLHESRITALTRAMITGQVEIPESTAPASQTAHSTASTAATWVVTSCDNSGPGTLRAIVDNFAQSGDTVDMTNLACSIDLQSSIVTWADDLTIKGQPGSLSGLSSSTGARPLLHMGTGTLTLDGLIVSSAYLNANFSTTLKGGCILSNGNVHLQNHSAVKYCSLNNTGSGDAVGAGIYAAGDVTIDESRVWNNTLGSSYDAHGGGIYAGGNVTLSGASVAGNRVEAGGLASGGGIFASGSLSSKYSMIGDNETSSNATIPRAWAGGAWIEGTSNWIRHTTIYDNTAQSGAGLVLAGSSPSGFNIIGTTTIADNTATDSNSKYGGALHIEGSDTTIVSSTISGNIESNNNEIKYGAGMHIQQGGGTVSIRNTVIADNSLVRANETRSPSDIIGSSDTTDVVVQGDHNFVAYALYVQMPGDTIGALTTPLLGPLQDNGGYTLTMSPLVGSLLIDAGETSSTWDQRGTGFNRDVGGADDIGAIEVGGDRIFANGFD